ncbi:MAG: sn-glycerol-3-phosphate ABC transporter ATP-binding protein UgpC, partial [Paracoccaceae bacterium]
MAALTVSNLVKSHGNQQILRGLNLDIPDGKFVVVLGPSGCGKTTLLRMIAGLEPISAGSVKIGGQRVNDMPAKDRNIAMVFQNYALYPHMTVRKNMGFSLAARKTAKARIAERVNRAAAILSLEPYLDRYPCELSGGQRQRVAMGRAIVRDPELFLFDEPLSNLDASLRLRMRGEITALHQRLGTTTLYVTHDQTEAMTMADLLVVMQDGQIVQSGPPLELYDRPANLFVAGFLGAPGMNLIEGTVTGRPGAQQIDWQGQPLPLPPGRELTSGQKVIYGIRPEHLVPSSSGAGIPARLRRAEATGAELQLYCGFAGQELCAVTRDRA